MIKIQPKVFHLHDGHKMTVRSATTEDMLPFKKLERSVIEESIFSIFTLEDFDQIDDNKFRTKIQSHIENENYLFLVAEIEQTIVGILELSHPPLTRLRHVANFGINVNKSFRSLGIGQILMQEMIAWAKNKPSLEKLHLKTHSTNVRAIEFYKKFGFVIEGVLLKEIKYSETEYVDIVCMGLKL